MTEALASRAEPGGFESRAMVETVAEFARRELDSRSLALDAREDGVFEQCWSGVRELGVDRAIAEERWMGSNVGTRDLLAIVQELATGDAGIALCVLLNNLALAIAGTAHRALLLDADRVALVPAPLEGFDRGDPLFVELRAGYPSISGTNGCALSALDADALVFEAISQGNRVVIATPAKRNGMAMAGDDLQMGLRSAAAASIELRRVEAEMCEADQGLLGTESARSLLRLGVAAIARGISRRAHAFALEYAQARRQGGVPIIQHGAVRDMLGAMTVRRSRPVPTQLDLAVALAAKIGETDAAVETTRDAVQIMGGAGYMRESGLEKLMRDAKYCQLYPEPNWIGRDALSGA